MGGFYPADGESRIKWDIIDALRRYGTDSARICHAFAALHRLQPSDVQARVAIISADGHGTPRAPQPFATATSPSPRQILTR